MKKSTVWQGYLSGDHQKNINDIATNLGKSGSIDQLHAAGLSFLSLNFVDEAVPLLQSAAIMAPSFVHLFGNAGLSLMQHGKREEALWFAERGLIAHPRSIELLLLKAGCLTHALQDTDAAIQTYLQVLAIDPNNHPAMVQLGNLHRLTDDFDAAKQWFAKAEAINPNYALLRIGRATMYSQLGEFDAAIAELRKCGAHPEAIPLLGMLLLGEGDFDTGWRLNFQRYKSDWFRERGCVVPPKPFRKAAEARNKKVAVMQEGGLGDVIQFARHLPDLAEIAQSVTVFVPKTLERLFQQNFPMLDVRVNGIYNAEDYDLTTSTLDLPAIFDVTLDSIPADLPYFCVQPADLTKHRLPETGKKRVGLCWQGGKQSSWNGRNYDTRRSLSFGQLYEAVASTPNVEFYSLQYEHDDSHGIQRPLRPEFDMLDTAAIVAQMDLIISVDTSLVHLAASMNQFTWMLSRYDCCWRWLRNKPTSPWYPDALRLYAQHAYRDWSQPLAQIKHDLYYWAVE